MRRKRAEKRLHHYLYKITRFDGMYYIGMHSTDDLEDGYLGSGKRITRSVKKYGASQHKKEILETFSSRAELKNRELEIVNEELLEDPLCMNLKLGGAGGWDHIDIRGDNNPMRRPAVAAKVAMSGAKSWTPDRREQMSKQMHEMRNAMSVQPRAGKHHTEESKALMSQNRHGKGGWNRGLKLGPDTDETRKKKQQAALKRVESGFDMGALGRGKKYNLKQKVCPHCGTSGSGPNMTRFHFDNCRNITKA
jgi:hypothetical protein